MPKMSEASKRRKAAGITQEKDPKKVVTGYVNAKTGRAKRAEQPDKALKNLANAEILKRANEALKQPQTDTTELLERKRAREAEQQQIQAIKKNVTIRLFQDSAELVAKRLVKLALGQDSFELAPASVQRLAMIDVLTLAGINSEQADKQSKPVHEMTKQELEQFINSTKSLIEAHDKSLKARVIEGETVNNA